MSAIYIHIPFCKRLCGYCDFFKSVKTQQIDASLEAMREEIVSQRNFLSDHNIETIYFGGGTPSLISVQAVGEFIDLISQHYDVGGLKEVTLEANPDDITLEYLEGLRCVGVNRLSIGVQSFDDDELRFMNRRHSSQQAIEAVRMAQSVGFDNITIDLIFGVDGFGIETLNRSIDIALSLGVQHISAYHLTIEDGTQFARKVSKGEFAIVAEQVSEEEYSLLEQRLSEAGFEHYEVSNYALEGRRSLHNSSYWQGVEYLGIGAGAHSYNGEVRRMNIESIEGYLSGEDGRYQTEVLSQIDRYNEFVMTSLRCCEGIDINVMRSKFPYWLYLYIIEVGKSWIERGILCHNEDYLYIPTRYFLLSDAVIESLFFDGE